MNPTEKKYAKAAQKMLIFESGLAVSEMKQSKMDVLHMRMAEQYKTRLDDFDPVSSDNLHDHFIGKTYAFTLRDNLIESFKKSIDETDGKKMWKAYSCLKSELINHWLPHFDFDSGWDIDDAVERVRMHAWAWRANKTIKTGNRKAEMEGRELDPEKLYTEAPEGSNLNIPLELPIVKKYHDHPFLQVNIRALDDGTDSEKEEDGKFTSVVSSLKKRKQQRREQKDFDKKARSANSNGSGDEKFEMQAAAANRQIAVAEGKNMIEFLRIAQDSSVWDSSELKDMFVSAKNSIFGESQPPAPTHEPQLVTDSLQSDNVDSDGDCIYS